MANPGKAMTTSTLAKRVSNVLMMLDHKAVFNLSSKVHFTFSSSL